MTDTEVIDQAANNPAVIAAYTKYDANGAPILPTPAALKQQAGTMLQFVIGELLMDQSIRRRILERSMSIAPTAVEFTCDAAVSRVLGILTGTSLRPLKVFDNKADHDLWLYQNYNTEALSSDDVPVAVYESGRAANGAIKITFSPGIGQETSFTMRYVRNPGSTLTLNLFPSDVHAGVFLGVVNAMTNGQFDQRYHEMKLDMARTLEVLAGGHSKMRHDPKVRRALRRLSYMSSGGGSSWDAQSSQKWAD